MRLLVLLGAVLVGASSALAIPTSQLEGKVKSRAGEVQALSSQAAETIKAKAQGGNLGIASSVSSGALISTYVAETTTKMIECPINQRTGTTAAILSAPSMFPSLNNPGLPNNVPVGGCWKCFGLGAGIFSWCGCDMAWMIRYEMPVVLTEVNKPYTSTIYGPTAESFKSVAKTVDQLLPQDFAFRQQMLVNQGVMGASIGTISSMQGNPVVEDTLKALEGLPDHMRRMAPEGQGWDLHAMAHPLAVASKAMYWLPHNKTDFTFDFTEAPPLLLLTRTRMVGMATFPAAFSKTLAPGSEGRCFKREIGDRVPRDLQTQYSMAGLGGLIPNTSIPGGGAINSQIAAQQEELQRKFDESVNKALSDAGVNIPGGSLARSATNLRGATRDCVPNVTTPVFPFDYFIGARGVMTPTDAIWITLARHIEIQRSTTLKSMRMSARVSYRPSKDSMQVLGNNMLAKNSPKCGEFDSLPKKPIDYPPGMADKDLGMFGVFNQYRTYQGTWATGDNAARQESYWMKVPGTCTTSYTAWPPLTSMAPSLCMPFHPDFDWSFFDRGGVI